MNTKINELAETPTEELLSKRKKIMGAAIGLAIVSIVALTIIFYVAITRKNFALLALTGGIMLPFLPIFIYLKQVEKEISMRNA